MKNHCIAKQWRWGLFWLGLTALYTGLRWHTFFTALVHDDGLFLYGAQALAAGQWPYRDFWDHKPPGIFIFQALPLLLFPFSLFAVKCFQIVCLALGAVFLFALCRRFFSLGVSLLTVLAYAFYTSHPETIQSGGLTEESALLFVIVGCWLAVQKPSLSWSRCLAAGLFFGFAIQFRQTFLAEALFVVFYIIAQNRRRRWPASLHCLFVFGAGMLIPELALSVIFFLNGAWFDYFEASYLINFYYIGAGGPSRNVSGVARLLWEDIQKTGPYLYAPLLAIPALFGLPKQQRWLLPALLLAYLGDAMAVALSGEYYNHYYVQAGVTLALLLAIFIEGAFNSLRYWQRRYFCLPNLAIAAAVMLGGILPTFWGLQGYWQGIQPSWQIISPSKTNPPPYDYQQSVAHAVQRLTRPDERILLIGQSPNSVYFLAQRYAGSRYYHFSPLWKPKFSGAYMQRHRQNFLHDLQQRKPVLLLIDMYRLRGGPLSRIDTHTPNALAYIEQHYTPLHEAVEIDLNRLWPWYAIRLVFYVRNDSLEAIRSRLENL